MANFDVEPHKKRLRPHADERNDGQPAFFNYSSNQQRKHDDEARANHILLLTVVNPAYPINVDVIHTITSPLGKVLRIVIFKKNGVQAMVEFEDIESARQAKQSLNGADIYSGCCTLKIEYAKPDRLNVHKNDMDSWDYTVSDFGKDDGFPQQRQGPLLQNPPRIGVPPQPFSRSSAPSPRRGSGVSKFSGGMKRHAEYDDYEEEDDCYDLEPYRDEQYGGHNNDRYGGRDDFHGSHSRGPGRHFDEGGLMSGSDSQKGCVAMVYGMNAEKMNCDRVFNVFCLYGNVTRVKFLKTKEGCAMVQMGEPMYVDRVIYNLNNLEFFDKKMQLSFSKQAFLNDVQKPFELPDGSLSFKDYMGSRNNRFVNADAASKNRIALPSKVLHYFNAPFEITEDELMDIFSKNDIAPPISMKKFNSKTERSSSGLMEFDSIADAVAAVAVCNHVPLTNTKSKFPFIMKLCFSASSRS